MAIHIDVTSTRTISYEEYAEYLTEYVDMRDDAAVIASAEWLSALNNNKSLLLDILNRELTLDNYSPDSLFVSHHSLVIGRGVPKRGGVGFTVRLNIWPTLPATALTEAHKDRVEQSFSYGYPHDHSFTLLTAGFFGPGYETDIYEHDPDACIGKPDEPVALRFLERARLAENDILFFRKSNDIHVQIPPQSISVSLNLLPEQASDGLTEQFVFDLERRRISGYIAGSRVSGRVAIVEAPGYFGIEESIPTLVDILASSPNARVRSAALSSLLRLDKANRERFISIASNDKSRFVREFVKEIA